jgi:ribosomal protein S18 acetylase RimI-like enzyme
VVFYVEDDHIHLESVAVLPSRSGKGVGKRLIDHAEQFAQQAGLKAVELYTNEAMAENLAMYSKLGYQVIGRKIQAGFHRVFFRKPV